MRRAIAVWAIAGCSSPAAPVPVAPQAPVHNVAPPITVVRRTPPSPTFANAGAKTCTQRDPVLLGPHGAANAVVGFDGRRGLAAWIREPNLLGLQAIRPDGGTIGTSFQIAIPADTEPRTVLAFGDSFVVLLRRWDYKTPELNWWGVVVDTTGHVTTPPMLLGIADLDITATAVVDDRHFALEVGPGYISKVKTAVPHVQMITVAPTGAMSSAVSTDPLPVTPAADISVTITNGATPPPRGAGGRIYEAMAETMFERMHGDQRVGDALELMHDGNAIAQGMHLLEAEIGWSGTHFLYPFWAADHGPTHDKYAQFLLPIDCTP